MDKFKAGKVRLHMMLQDSADEMIREVQPEVKSGQKWTAEQAVTEAEASLRSKDIVGAVQGSSRAGQGNNTHRWFSARGPKGRREMVIEEVRTIDEERRSATAAEFALAVLGRAGKRQNRENSAGPPLLRWSH